MARPRSGCHAAVRATVDQAEAGAVLSIGAETLREEVDHWRALVNHLPALVAYWDRDLRNVVANAAYLEWFGLTPRQVRGMHLRDVIGPEVYDANRPYVEGALAGRHQRFDRTLVTASGQTRHTQAEYVPHANEDGSHGFYVLVTDVTEKVEAQRDLLAVEQDLLAAQSLGHMGSYTFEPATGSLRFSPELVRILGHDPEGPGPTPEEYVAAVHPDDRHRIDEVSDRAMQGEGYETSYRIVRPDGAVRHVQSRTSRVLGPDGEVVLLRGVMQDQTDTQRLADELATTNRLLTDLIGMLGHDLRQPVAVTNGYLEHLDQEWDQTPEQERRELLTRAMRSGMRVEGLLGDILGMVSDETSQVLTRPEPVDVGAVLDEVRDPDDAGLVLVRETRTHAWVDPLHLRRILENLLGNAARYGRPPVVATVAAAAGEVVVSLRDHGEGVPPDFVPHLFERFARATTGVASRVAGTGFGLHLVRELARANGGDVHHREPDGGPGAVFELRLPSASPPST